MHGAPGGERSLQEGKPTGREKQASSSAAAGINHVVAGKHAAVNCVCRLLSGNVALFPKSSAPPAPLRRRDGFSVGFIWDFGTFDLFPASGQLASLAPASAR